MLSQAHIRVPAACRSCRGEGNSWSFRFECENGIWDLVSGSGFRVSESNFLTKWHDEALPSLF